MFIVLYLLQTCNLGTFVPGGKRYSAVAYPGLRAKQAIACVARVRWREVPLSELQQGSGGVAPAGSRGGAPAGG